MAWHAIADADLSFLQNVMKICTWSHLRKPLDDFYTWYSRFTCLRIAILFIGSFRAVLFFADSRRKKGFQPVESLYFCVGQKKSCLKRTSKNNRYFGTCKPVSSFQMVAFFDVDTSLIWNKQIYEM